MKTGESLFGSTQTAMMHKKGLAEADNAWNLAKIPWEYRMVVVEGVIWPGATAASLTVSKQLPFFIPYVPDAARLHPATINVLFPTGAAIRITVPDIVTPALPWRGPNLMSERFAFTRIGFEFPVGGTPLDAWIYTAEQSHHRFDMGLIEILAQKIEGVAYRQACKLHIDREAVTLVS